MILKLQYMIVCFACFELYTTFSEADWHRRLEVTKQDAVLVFSGRLWHDIHDLKGVIQHHPASICACEVFISHCWGRQGFVCSGTLAAVEQLEKVVENQLLALQISLWMMVGECQNCEWTEFRFLHCNIASHVNTTIKIWGCMGLMQFFIWLAHEI